MVVSPDKAPHQQAALKDPLQQLTWSIPANSGLDALSFKPCRSERML
jgi:hypothetical protein